MIDFLVFTFSYMPLNLLPPIQIYLDTLDIPAIYIGSLIHPDQSGFIPDRYSFSNTRCLLNVMYPTKLPHAADVLLDAQQAFDQVEWKYMCAALEKFGFGLKCMNILKMLYAGPQSSVLTNNERSPPFSLHCGTRQGCCVSPMLFSLALEPLAIAIRASPQISGINCATFECTFGLYGDDVILTLLDVRTSLSPFLI